MLESNSLLELSNKLIDINSNLVDINIKIQEKYIKNILEIYDNTYLEELKIEFDLNEGYFAINNVILFRKFNDKMKQELLSWSLKKIKEYKNVELIELKGTKVGVKLWI
ncbi:hypothetical protein [Clostridium chrysemydis]|uniref:hypothetical protein n=1 Tax=Clostridium chrysemydis TaxID=2665504 RepID=UPI001883B1F3|nr:hypothetical protein [Clostridium chrysemydis]